MSVVPVVRLPAIGTFFTLYGDAGLSTLLPMLKLERWLNIEFHGIDLLDSTDMPEGDTLDENQPDLSTPYPRKKELFSRWLGELSPGRDNKTLAAIAADLQASEESHE